MAATSEQATVELTSPTTSTTSGRCMSDERFEGGHDRRGLGGVTAGTDLEHVLRRSDVELGEEHVAHPVVVVLAGVDEHGAHAAGFEGGDHRLELREVRACAGDAHHGERIRVERRLRGGQCVLL